MKMLHQMEAEEIEGRHVKAGMRIIERNRAWLIIEITEEDGVYTVHGMLTSMDFEPDDRVTVEKR
ncbi:hypothetical protein [Kitasatospora sp. MBT66]|uniref:hypothetical protein n=1 Tax=Kitasatospora sp. MBT66 TaxID=1444769 RepID=UPI0005BE4F65|nr:hypothetical protein [Kitasatospora sp. MBT66]